VSGLDHPGDGRGGALIDVDRDGWQDVALVSANAPMLQVFRSRLGERSGAEQRGFVALRLRGAGTPGGSNRDGYGAQLIVHAGGRAQLRELRCGEGFASQNSDTILVGLGSAAAVERIEVRWPSGRDSLLPGPIASGSLVEIWEDPAQAPHGKQPAPRRYSPGGRGKQ
jgi:hypothetical protein